MNIHIVLFLCLFNSVILQTVTRIVATGPDHYFYIATSIAYNANENSLIFYGGADSNGNTTSNLSKLRIRDWTWSSLISSGTPPVPRVGSAW